MLSAYKFAPDNNCMKPVDFTENELYLKICGEVRHNVYDGEKRNAPDAATSRAQKEKKKNHGFLCFILSRN